MLNSRHFLQILSPAAAGVCVFLQVSRCSCSFEYDRLCVWGMQSNLFSRIHKVAAAYSLLESTRVYKNSNPTAVS